MAKNPNPILEEGEEIDEPSSADPPSKRLHLDETQSGATNSPNNTATPSIGSESSASKRFKGASKFDEYELKDKIGEGTFGEVRIAYHKKTGAKVALKKILLHNEKEGLPITAIREIKILKSLNHPNIVSLTEMAYQRAQEAKARGILYMVFPYMDHDLSGLLNNPAVQFTYPMIKSYMKQLLEGIRYLHKNNILHRDIKSANILINNEGNLKIADFGLSRPYYPDDPTRDYTKLVVTRWYRPPELLLGESKYSTAVDMWGIGCVFGEILLRRPILEGSGDLDQLKLIFELCGPPTNQTWPDYEKKYLNHAEILRGQDDIRKSIHRRQFSTFFSSVAHLDGVIPLLESILVLNPEKRATAESALTHRFFFTNPLPAKVAQEFISFNTSHEYGTRLMRMQMDAAKNLEGGRSMVKELPPHLLPEAHDNSHYYNNQDRRNYGRNDDRNNRDRSNRGGGGRNNTNYGQRYDGNGRNNGGNRYNDDRRGNNGGSSSQKR